MMVFTTLYVICTLITSAEGGGRLFLTLMNYNENIKLKECGDCKVSVSIKLVNGVNEVKKYESKEYKLTKSGIDFKDNVDYLTVIFSFKKWSGELTYNITLLKRDSSNRKIIFKQFIEVIKLPVNKAARPINHRLDGRGGPLISFTVQAKCNEHFYNKCDKYCKSSNSPETGHYTCSSTGDKICNDDWKGVECKISKLCGRVTCKNGATCVYNVNKRQMCLCTPWYTGLTCANRKSACKVLKNCQNGATCADIGYSDRNCICKKGYRGTLCELKVSPCDSQPCENSQKCSNEGTEDYKCHCIPGYTGKRCDVDLNECTLVPKVCKNNATCTNTVGNYHCTCALGYMGKNCDQCTGHLFVNGRCRPDLELSNTDVAWVLIVSFSLIISALLSYIFLLVRTLWPAADPTKQ